MLPADWRQEAYFEYDFRNIGFTYDENILGLRPDECALSVLRSRRYKYVHFTSLPPVLYDLEKDPHELHNCIGDPAYTEIALACAQKMLSWRMSNDDRELSNVFVRNGARDVADERRGYRSLRGTS